MDYSEKTNTQIVLIFKQIYTFRTTQVAVKSGGA